MNGFLIISLTNGMLLFSYSNNNYGINNNIQNNKNKQEEEQERNERKDYEISSFLYAIYTLTKQIKDKNNEINEDNNNNNSNNSYNNKERNNFINENIVMGFNESPLLYFQQGSIIWHFYESSGQNSDVLIIISCNYQIKHNYAYIFAANLSQIFLSKNIISSSSLTPRGSVTKQIKEDYQQLIQSRINELINILFLNVFQNSTSFCIVYNPNNCISLISEYHRLLRGEYMINDNIRENFSYNIKNNNYNNDNDNNERLLVRNELEYSNEIEQPMKTIQVSQSNPELKVSPNIIQPKDRPITAENTTMLIENQDKLVSTSKKSNFISLSFQWIRKKLKFGKVTQIKNESSDVKQLHSIKNENNFLQSPSSLLESSSIQLPLNESSLKEQEIPLVKECNIKWNFFTTPSKDDNNIELTTNSQLLSNETIPLLSNLIQLHNESYNQMIKSNYDQNSSEIKPLSPFILSTTLSSLNQNNKNNNNFNHNHNHNEYDNNNGNDNDKTTVHIVDISNSIYFTPSTSHSEIYLIWNDETNLKSQSSSELNKEIKTNKLIWEIFQSNFNLKILFLEFLELQVQQYF